MSETTAPPEAQAPKPSEVWRNRDSGLEVSVAQVYGDPGERRVAYTRPEWDEPLEMSLALWPSHYVRVEAQEPRPGEVWCRYDGAFAQVLEVRGGRVHFGRPSWGELFEEPLTTWHDQYRPANCGEADNRADTREPAPGSQSIGERQRRARLWLRAVANEVEYRQRQHRPFASAHEGLAIFEEEAEELQREVRHGTLSGIVEEAIQAAAMAVRILVDIGGEPPNGEDGDE